ncbi:MAG TPA: hypothetical protein VKB65_05710 [Myxococcota bacterium]|nr:hypothetical protein [Myxococcota bacterium]
MHPPTSRRVAGAAVVALALGLVPMRVEASVLDVSGAADDPGRIGFEAGRAAPLEASAFDPRVFIQVDVAWLEPAPRVRASASAAPLRALLVEESEEVIQRYDEASNGLRSTTSTGLTVVDAWLLLTMPFALPIVVMRRQRRASRTWADQIAGGLDEQAHESALDAIVRSPYEASSLGPDASPM